MVVSIPGGQHPRAFPDLAAVVHHLIQCSSGIQAQKVDATINTSQCSNMTFTWGTSTCTARESVIHLSVDQLFKTLCWKFDYILPDINESPLGRLRTLQLDICSQELMQDVPCQAGWMCWWHYKYLNPGNMSKAGQCRGEWGEAVTVGAYAVNSTQTAQETLANCAVEM